jgi:hypothetical protein
MNRGLFLRNLLWLFGFGVAAKAQQWKEPIVENHLWTGQNKAKLNNQCPVCGTMAPVYKPDRRWCADYAGLTPNTNAPGCDGNQNLTRCAHCNAAFWQDAE